MGRHVPHASHARRVSGAGDPDGRLILHLWAARRVPLVRVAFAFVALSLTACAPGGDPPAGRQLVAGRGSTPAGFVADQGDGLTRLLLTRPGQSAFTLDLYALSFDPASTATPATEQLLFADLPSPSGYGCFQQMGSCFETDGRGRLLLNATQPDGTGIVDLVRVDPVTGQRLDLGPSTYHELSPDGQRLVVHGAARSDRQATLYDQDERVVPLGAISQDIFAGPFLYYLDDQQRLLRLAVGGTAEVVTTGVDSFAVLPTPGVPLLTLSRPTTKPTALPSEMTPDAISFLDTGTMEETPSPLGSAPFDVSPDGQWLITVDYIVSALTFVNRLTGAREVIPSFVLYEWRPGHDEVWLWNPQASSDTIAIRRPGLPLQLITGKLFPVSSVTNRPSPAFPQARSFTPDGLYWFSNEQMYGPDSLWQVGAADDPTGPRFPVTPRGSSTNAYWKLADGRLLAEVWTSTPVRANVYIIDPSTGDRRVMGEEGAVVAVGATRFLMNQHINEYEGDLTVFELATGKATVLAPEFTLAVFVQPHDTDDVAPGVLVAYQYQARFASPYDGVWIVSVP